MNLPAIFSFANIVYFAVAAYLGYLNYQKSDHSGFWLHLTLVFCISTIVSITNFAKYVGLILKVTGDIIDVVLGIEIAVLFFTAVYTLTKKHHEEHVF
ncbi:MAG: hypothetical protein ACE5PM_04075 [Candidatus Hydrothermarchaeales archaeon]